MTEVASSSWGVYGTGIIGGELQEQLANPKVAKDMGLQTHPSFVLRKSGVYVPNGEGGLEKIYDALGQVPKDQFPTVVFNALPSDMPQLSQAYMDMAFDAGSLVVTAEKAALANNFGHFVEISENFRKLGDNASVGGGTRPMEGIMPYLRDPRNVTQIHGVFNGTMQDMATTLSEGRTPGEAVRQARIQHYAEPGATSFHDVIKGEAEGDIPKKAAIFFNRTGLASEKSAWLHPSQMEFDLTDKEISKYIAEAPERRFIVSYYNLNARKKDARMKFPEGKIIGGFDIVHAGWRIVAGFRKVSRNGMFKEAAQLTGPGNVVVVGLGPQEDDGPVTIAKGQGAGAEPTVNTMIDDWLRLRKENGVVA